MQTENTLQPHNPIDPRLAIYVPIYFGDIEAACTENPITSTHIPPSMDAYTVHRSLEPDRYYVTGGNNSGNPSNITGTILYPKNGKTISHLLPSRPHPIKPSGNHELVRDLEGLFEDCFLEDCYHRYQLHWMALHGHSLDDLMESMDEYASILIPEGDTPETVTELYGGWQDSGFHYNRWVCMQEFGECEFQDPGYMENILLHPDDVTYYNRLFPEHPIKMEVDACE